MSPRPRGDDGSPPGDGPPLGGGPPSGPTDRRGPVEIRATRGVVLRDFAIFQLKLLLDGFKDVVLSALSLGALVLDLLSGGGRRPRLFYRILGMSERFDMWLNLSGAVTRLETEELDEDGLFGASPSGSDTLLGKVEELVRGGDAPRRRRGRSGDGASSEDPGKPGGESQDPSPD